VLQNRDLVLKIRDIIIEYHEKFKVAVPFPSYVMDIVVYEDFTCHLIEFNPFGAHMSSGAALFNWSVDGPLLYGKLQRQLPVIRVLKELIPKDNSTPVVRVENRVGENK